MLAGAVQAVVLRALGVDGEVDDRGVVWWLGRELWVAESGVAWWAEWAPGCVRSLVGLRGGPEGEAVGRGGRAQRRMKELGRWAAGSRR